jgi:ribonucleoside-diphosphate reductase alpha chain
VRARLTGHAVDVRPPGILFLDRVNRDNNHYCETLGASNPCAENCLYACCLGSIDLTRFVRDPFTEKAS